MTSQSSELTRPAPKSGGLAHALWIIARPTPRVAIEPTASGVRYSDAKRRGIAPLCDIYRPNNSESVRPAPSVLLIHGGAFMIGNRGMKPIRYVAARLAQAGIGVCSIDYRLVFRGGGVVAALEDVDQAATFWKRNAGDFGCGEQMSLMGLSAGATLMLMHASASQERYTSLVNAYGATDFSSVRGRRAMLVMRLIHQSRDRELWKSRSPLFANPIQSPILNLHGKLDQLIPVEHSIRYHQQRLDTGYPSQLELYDEAPHGWLCDTRRSESEQSLARAAAFIHEHSRAVR